MKQLREDIKTGEFKHIYCLFGEETYLKRSFKEQLKNALVGDDTMNFQHFEGNIDLNRFKETAETMPFFAERRLILWEDSGLFKKDAGKLPDYLSEIPDSTYVVFVESEVDKRNRLYKTVASLGYAAQMNRQSEADLSRWILSILKKERKKITAETMELFLSMTGSDMEYIRTELDKILAYVGDREVIVSEDIEILGTAQITGKVFDMVRAISEKRQEPALKLYYDLLALHEPAMRILFLITRQFNQLIQTKELSEAGYDDASIASAAGMKPFAVKKLRSQVRRFTREALKISITRCAELEEAVKTGNLNDILAVELLIISLSS